MKNLVTSQGEKKSSLDNAALKMVKTLLKTAIPEKHF